MTDFILDVATEVQELPSKNQTSKYLPVRNKSEQNNFTWKNIESVFLSYTLNVATKNYSLDQLKHACKEQILDKLGKEEIWHVIEEMYFSSWGILQCSPVFSILSIDGANSVTEADRRVAQLLYELIEPQYVEQAVISSELNFLEQEFFDIYQKQLKPSNSEVKNEPYLPFLSKVFTADVKFMFENPKFMQHEFQNMLSFYAFSYCAQLALNVQGWKNGAPTPKPLYFLLDNETASQERTYVVNDGFKALDESLMNVFPVLTMLENIQPNNCKLKVPLWKIAQAISQSTNKEQIAESLGLFANLKKQKDGLRTLLPETATASEWLDKLVELTRDEFWDGSKPLKGGMAQKYQNQIKNQLGKERFYRPKGRSGNVLELNQDMILLLTNLSIGNEPNLRFAKLIAQFESRGVFFDEDSQDELINFYERIGIIERMSDSGEAVNVRKTI